MRGAHAADIARASCTRFSPKTLWPAASAGATASAGGLGYRDQRDGRRIAAVLACRPRDLGRHGGKAVRCGSGDHFKFLVIEAAIL